MQCYSNPKKARLTVEVRQSRAPCKPHCQNVQHANKPPLCRKLGAFVHSR